MALMVPVTKPAAAESIIASPAIVSTSSAIEATLANLIIASNAVELWLELGTELLFKRFALRLVRYGEERPVRENFI